MAVLRFKLNRLFTSEKTQAVNKVQQCLQGNITTKEDQQLGCYLDL